MLVRLLYSALTLKRSQREEERRGGESERTEGAS